MAFPDPGFAGLVLEGLPWGVAVLDARGQWIGANAALAAWASKAPDDPGLLDALFPLPAARDRLIQKAADFEAFDDLELSTGVPDDPHRRHLAIGGRRVEGGFTVLTFHDLTHRRAYERVIEASFDKFIEVTIALDRAVATIGSQNTVLEEFRSRLTRELGVARGVQKALVPREFPAWPDFDLWGVGLPTDELGGDSFAWYDLGEGRVGLLIADVSGHGVPASLVSTLAKAAFDDRVRQSLDPAAVLERVNADLTAAIGDTGFYITALYGVLDRSTREFQVALAGHEAAWCEAGGQVSRLGADQVGTILGAFADSVYQTTTHLLPPGARVLACTDGIVEARGPSGAFFGAGGIEALLATQGRRSSRQTVEDLIAATDRHFAGLAPNDDRAVWVFRLLDPEADRFTEDLLRRAFAQKDFGQVTETLGTDPLDWPPALRTLGGEAWAHRGQWDEAARWLRSAAEGDPSSARAWYYLGLVLHNAGDRPGALEAWTRADGLEPNYKNVRSLLAQGTAQGG